MQKHNQDYNGGSPIGKRVLAALFAVMLVAAMLPIGVAASPPPLPKMPDQTPHFTSPPGLTFEERQRLEQESREQAQRQALQEQQALDRFNQNYAQQQNSWTFNVNPEMPHQQLSILPYGFFLTHELVLKGRDYANGNFTPKSTDPSGEENYSTQSDLARLTPTSEFPLNLEASPNMPAIYANAYCELGFIVKNISNVNLKLCEVFLEADAGQDFPFEIQSTKITGAFYDNGLDNNEGGITFPPLLVKRDIATGYYKVNFTIRFQAFERDSQDTQSQIYEQKLSYTLKVEGNPDNKENVRELITTAPLPTPMGSYGGPMNLQLGILNRGFDPVDIISVTPKISDDVAVWPFEIEKSDYSVALGKKLLPLSPGSENGSEGSGTLLICDFGNVNVRRDISSGYKQVTFTVQYKYGNQAIKTTDLTLYVDIAGNPEKDAEGKGNGKEWPQSKPRLLCLGYDTDPEKIEGGETFNLTIHLKNTSTITAIQNIRVDISSDPVGENGSAPFLTESGASSVYIPWIDADTTYDLEVSMVSSVQVPQRIYPLKLQMEYEDMMAAAIQASEAVSIPLFQPVRVDTGKIEIMPQELEPGQEANLMFPIYNKGKTTLYNVSVTVPEGQGISGSEVYLGNINAGDKGQVDMMIMAEDTSSPDPTRTLRINYEDENGNKQSEDASFDLMIMEPPPMPDDMENFPPGMGQMEVPGEDTAEGDNGIFSIMPLWAWILIALVLFIILAVVISQLLKRRRRKKIQEADADYFRDLLNYDQPGKAQASQATKAANDDAKSGIRKSHLW